MSEIKSDPEQGCILWEGKVHRGYPPSRVYRRAYERVHGPIPADHQVHHTCENRRCVNPMHLVALTQREHLLLHWRDRGLSETQLMDIVRLLGSTNLTQAEIAARLGIPRTTVNNVARGRHSALDAPVEPPPRACVLCGGTISHRRRSARFCSVEHRRTYNSRLQNERRKASKGAGLATNQPRPQK